MAIFCGKKQYLNKRDIFKKIRMKSINKQNKLLAKF